MFSHRFFFVRDRIGQSVASVFVPLSKSTVSTVPPAYRFLTLTTCHWQRNLKSDSSVMAPITTTGEEVIESQPEVQQPSKLLFVKLTEHASAPSKGSKYAAGYDLKSAYEVVVPKRGSALVKTDIQIQLPSGTYGRVAPRSGLALKNKIDVGAGVIDEDYRGNVGVILFNHGDEDFSISKGDRIAQLICEKILYPEAVEVENLDATERGGDGFGSTGVKKPKLDVEEEKEVPGSPTKKGVDPDVKVLSPQKQPSVPAQ